MLIGDKTELGNDWYPPTVKQIEGTMIGEWYRRHPKPQAPITEQSPSTGQKEPITMRPRLQENRDHQWSTIMKSYL